MGKSLEVANVPNAPVFKAASNATNVPDGLTTTFFTSYGSAAFDPTSAFNPATGRFQPAVAGYYQINALVSYGVNGILASAVTALIVKNGSGSDALAGLGSSTTTYPSISVSSIVYMNGTTDYVQVGTYHNAGTTATSITANFTGALIRPA